MRPDAPCVTTPRRETPRCSWTAQPPAAHAASHGGQRDQPRARRGDQGCTRATQPSVARKRPGSRSDHGESVGARRHDAARRDDAAHRTGVRSATGDAGCHPLRRRRAGASAPGRRHRGSSGSGGRAAGAGPHRGHIAAARAFSRPMSSASRSRARRAWASASAQAASMARSSSVTSSISAPRSRQSAPPSKSGAGAEYAAPTMPRAATTLKGESELVRRGGRSVPPMGEP